MILKTNEKEEQEQQEKITQGIINDDDYHKLNDIVFFSKWHSQVTERKSEFSH